MPSKCNFYSECMFLHHNKRLPNCKHAKCMFCTSLNNFLIDFSNRLCEMIFGNKLILITKTWTFQLLAKCMLGSQTNNFRTCFSFNKILSHLVIIIIITLTTPVWWWKRCCVYFCSQLLSSTWNWVLAFYVFVWF